MNNPYMNNFFGQYPQYQQPYQTQQSNPYLDRLNNLQQFQQSLQPVQQIQMQMQQQNYLSGKVVDSIDVVKATDIPMDGNLYYFPKADGTEIYAKTWLSNGTTRILTFKPAIEEPINSASNDLNSQIMANNELAEVFTKRFDSLDKRFDELEQSWAKSLTKSTASRTKKENEAE